VIGVNGSSTWSTLSSSVGMDEILEREDMDDKLVGDPWSRTTNRPPSDSGSERSTLRSSTAADPVNLDLELLPDLPREER
jgi:hypothetical protein